MVKVVTPPRHRPAARGALHGVALALVVGTTGSVARAERNPLPPYLHDGKFEQIADKRGVKVYKHRSSDIIRIGAQAVFPTPPRRVQRALLDYHRQVGKIARLSEARVLGRGEGQLHVYQRLNLPVISDRDFVLEVRYGRQRGDTLWLAYRAVTDRGPPPRGGVVRVSHHRGSWELQPARGGKATRVTFQTSIDLGGWLPKWMARAGAGRELPELFAAICRLSRPDARQGRCP
jgi:hypothetical protein